MLERAGYPEIAAQIDLEEVVLLLPELDSCARDLFASKRNTVKHNRGTDVFEAGNVKFGLEMRRLQQNRMLAVVVQVSLQLVDSSLT